MKSLFKVVALVSLFNAYGEVLEQPLFFAITCQALPREARDQNRTTWDTIVAQTQTLVESYQQQDQGDLDGEVFKSSLQRFAQHIEQVTALVKSDDTCALNIGLVEGQDAVIGATEGLQMIVLFVIKDFATEENKDSVINVLTNFAALCSENPEEAVHALEATFATIFETYIGNAQIFIQDYDVQSPESEQSVDEQEAVPAEADAQDVAVVVA